jgi:hypothetical protein
MEDLGNQTLTSVQQESYLQAGGNAFHSHDFENSNNSESLLEVI